MVLRYCFVLAAAFAPLLLAGCFAPKSQLTASETQNRVLAAQNRAQLAEIENLKGSASAVRDQLSRAEQDLARLQETVTLDQQRLALFQQENGELHTQFKGMAAGGRLPSAVSRQLEELAARYPNLAIDPATGISKVDTDVLFDSGQSELKPAAQAMLGELARVLQSPDAGQLKVMVVGHTDNRRIVGQAREKYPNNFHLSTARALSVADQLKRQGISEQRIGVAGFGPNQAVAESTSGADRQKNRRVEIFVMSPEVPIVGWTETPGKVY